MKLDSGNANIDGSGTIEAHLIPGINFGVSVFKGFARAEVFLEADAKAVLKLDFAKRTEVAEAEDAKEDEVVKEDDEDPQADNDIEEEDEEVAAEDEEAAGEDETVIEEDNGGAEADDEVVGDAESAGDEVLADGSEPGDNIEVLSFSIHGYSCCQSHARSYPDGHRLCKESQSHPDQHHCSAEGHEGSSCQAA